MFSNAEVHNTKFTRLEGLRDKTLVLLIPDRYFKVKNAEQPQQVRATETAQEVCGPNLS